MVIRLIETLLITIGNGVSRRWSAKSKAKLKLPPDQKITVPADHVIIGHILANPDGDGDIISTELLKSGVVALTPQARRRHLYLLGATGTGKTNLLLNLIESDIQNDRAFCVVDLRGDLVDRILLRLAETGPPDSWTRRLLLLDLRDNASVVGFNPLSGDGDVYTRAMLMLDVLKRQSDSWGVQLEETLRNSLIALAEAKRSLLEIEPLLTSKAYRWDVLKHVSDTHVQSFFKRYDLLTPANQTTWAMAVLNKVTPLLAIPQLRRMFGQTQSFSFRELLDHEPGMVILISLAVDRFHHASHLVGGLLVSAFQAAMMSRVDQSEQDRVPVTLYCDEFEMMASDRFCEIVAEGRRFGVGLCLSHQNLSQLSPMLRNVLLNNVRTQIYFQTGAGDAAELAKEISGDDTRTDIRRMLIMQNTGEAFLVRRGQASLRIRTLLSPDPYIEPHLVEALKTNCLATYARSLASVEAELDARAAGIDGLENKTSTANSSSPTYEIRHAKPTTFKPKEGKPKSVDNGRE